MQPVARIQRNAHVVVECEAGRAHLLDEPAGPVVYYHLVVLGGGYQDSALLVDCKIRPDVIAPRLVGERVDEVRAVDGADQGPVGGECRKAGRIPMDDDAAARIDGKGPGEAEPPGALNRSRKGARKGAVGVEDLQPGAVVIEDQYPAIGPDCDVGRVQERARPLARPAEPERGRAVGVEYVHVAGPRFGHDDPVAAVDGDAAVAGRVKLPPCTRIGQVRHLVGHVKRAERELHARRRPARGVVEPADHVDQGHFANVVLAGRNACARGELGADPGAGQAAVYEDHPAGRVDLYVHYPGLAGNDHKGIAFLVPGIGNVDVWGIVRKGSCIHLIRRRVVGVAVVHGKAHRVQQHDRLGRVAEVLLLPLGVELGHGLRGAAPDYGVDDGRGPDAHGVGAAGCAAGARAGIRARRICHGVDHVPQGRGHGSLHLFAAVLCVGPRGAQIALLDGKLYDGPAQRDHAAPLDVKGPAAVLHDGRVVDEVGDKVGHPLPPRAAVARGQLVDVVGALVVYAADHVHGMVGELVEDYESAARVVGGGGRRVAVEPDDVERRAVRGKVVAVPDKLPRAQVVPPEDPQACARLQPMPPKELPAVGYGVDYAGGARHVDVQRNVQVE